MRIAAIGGACLVVVACSTAQPVIPPDKAHEVVASRDFETALHDGDLSIVKQVAADDRRPSAEAALAQAALAYWWRLDRNAGEGLSQAVHNPALSEGLRRNALLLLSGLRMRQSRYAEALAALDAVLPLLADEHERTETRDARDVAAILAGAPPMQATVPDHGLIPLSRDIAGLTRGPVTINGGDLDAIIDTGSSVSTISEGNARRLGLHILPGQVAMGTATSSRASGSVAVADSVVFGQAEFHDVVFLVLPDSALTFANGAYVVQAIIGMPLLIELGRVEYSTKGERETLSYARTGGVPGADSNLIVASDEPFTFAHIAGSNRALRLFIDNGASTSHLNRRFATEYPAAMAGAHQQSVTRTGAAGSETQDAMKLPSLVLWFGERSATITDVDIVDDQHASRHGDLGLDALRTAPGYVLDFEAMHFELLVNDPAHGG